MPEYPTIMVLDLALYIKERIEILESNNLKGSPAAKKEIELMTKIFPQIGECIEYIKEIDVRYKRRVWADTYRKTKEEK
tara:strand:- start:6934 stop:7170 length:237 start_codon:yes stop_codon:yes gene_type:complete